MSLKFCSLSSGSSGNSYIIGTEDDVILIDVGISGKKILEGIQKLNIDFNKIKGVLVTHEHIDHIKSVGVISKKLPKAKVYANQGTWQHIKDKVAENQREEFETGSPFEIGDLEILPFEISHDATEPVGFTVKNEGKRITVVTDTGIITEEIFTQMKSADILVVEANYEENLLKMCSYPWSVKQRILSDIGHLSNEETGNFLCRILKEGEKKPRNILLAHLSGENNFPDLAYQTIKNIIVEKYGDENLSMDINVIKKNEISKVYKA